MRFFYLGLVFVLSGGCYASKTIPTFEPVSMISAKIYSVPELGITPVDIVEVPKDQIPSFLKLITPTKLYNNQIKKEMHYHVADVCLHHTDGKVTTLIVRWTGHNPAAISLDDRVYFWGGTDGFPDGAFRIIRFLFSYKNNTF
jgi:hypothetical protein